MQNNQTKLEMLLELNKLLLEMMPQYIEQANSFERNEENQRILFRSLMNISSPMPLSKEYLDKQDAYLSIEKEEKGIKSLKELTPIQKQIYLWRGDITKLEVDAIVNAANSALLGCFIPMHGCIDNAIHSASGLQLRRDCHEIMEKQGDLEKTGRAKITKAYNLPCKYVIHTVGPIIQGSLTVEDKNLLKKCYQECLYLAINQGLNSIAFCCISTGEYHFPNDIACQIAIETVREVLQKTESKIEVIFNVFKQIDYSLYNDILR